MLKAKLGLIRASTCHRTELRSGEERILAELKSLSSIDSVSKRVDHLSETVWGSPAKRLAEFSSSSSSWADRSDPPRDLSCVYMRTDAEDEETGESVTNLITLSEDNKSLLSSAFTSSLSNSSRRQIRNSFPLHAWKRHAALALIQSLSRPP